MYDAQIAAEITRFCRKDTVILITFSLIVPPYMAYICSWFAIFGFDAKFTIVKGRGCRERVFEEVFRGSKNMVNRRRQAAQTSAKAMTAPSHSHAGRGRNTPCDCAPPDA